MCSKCKCATICMGCSRFSTRENEFCLGCGTPRGRYPHDVTFIIIAVFYFLTVFVGVSLDRPFLNGIAVALFTIHVFVFGILLHDLLMLYPDTLRVRVDPVKVSKQDVPDVLDEVREGIRRVNLSNTNPEKSSVVEPPKWFNPEVCAFEALADD